MTGFDLLDRIDRFNVFVLFQPVRLSDFRADKPYALLQCAFSNLLHEVADRFVTVSRDTYTFSQSQEFKDDAGPCVRLSGAGRTLYT